MGGSVQHPFKQAPRLGCCVSSSWAVWARVEKMDLQGLARVLMVVAALLTCSNALHSCSDENEDVTRPPMMIPRLDYHPVVILPPFRTVLLNLTHPPVLPSPLWSIGKYDEDRVIYDQPLFGGNRTVHVGLDLGGPAHTAVHAFWDGEVIEAGINPAKGDYGPVIVTKHVLTDSVTIYALFGHLSKESVNLSAIGRRFQRGEVIAWLGTSEENGGWPPHVHFQLSWERPKTHDLPGAVNRADRDKALKMYPDPQSIVGKLYD